MPDVVDRHQLRRLVDEHDAQLVEVLPADEYEEGHLPGALHLPLKQLDAATAGRILELGRPWPLRGGGVVKTPTHGAGYSGVAPLTSATDRSP